MFYGRPILPLLRCAAVLLSIPGCDNPTATPPAPPAPAARSAIPTQADGPDVIVHPVGHDAEGYIIRHLQHDGSPDALEQAEASLRPLVGSWPAYGYGQMLLALVRELQGDTTTRSAILGTRSPEEQAAWAFLFRRSPSELELLLRCNQVNSCLAETTPRTFQAALDPFWHIRSGPEVLRCRSWTLPRAQCPAAVEVLSVSKKQLKLRMAEAGPLALWCDGGTPNARGAAFTDRGNGLFVADLPVGQRDRTITISR